MGSKCLGIKYAIENAKLNDDLLIIAGDNYYDFSISNVIEEFNLKSKIHINLEDQNYVSF